MPTKTINGRLEINVSHPWDRPEPIKQPEPHKDTIPTEDEIMEMLKYLYDNEPYVVAALLTEYDPELFLREGISYLNRD